MNEDIIKAVQVLKQGGIVIYPTDTAFGIGCRIDDEKAIERLFNIRKRPHEKAVPVLVDTVIKTEEYLEPIPKEVIDKLIEPYWPGALTIILHCNKVKMSSLVRGGGSTLGVRIPNNLVTRSLIRSLGVPILGPSANFAGEKTPYRLKDLNPDLVKQVDYVVQEESYGKEASTVIDCSQIPWRIVRQGAINVVV